MDFSPSKSTKVLKNRFGKIGSLYTPDHFSNQNGPVSAFMYIFPRIMRFGMDFSPSKSPKVLKNRFWKIGSLYIADHFLTQNGLILALMFIFPHIMRFGIDFSPFRITESPQKSIWKNLGHFTYLITFRPKMARFHP
jgi:hypothetical protein